MPEHSGNFRGELKFQYHTRRRYEIISLCQSGGVCLYSSPKGTSCQRGNLGIANSSLSSFFPSGLPIALDAMKFGGATPFPGL